jgi:hypothetical protein
VLDLREFGYVKLKWRLSLSFLCIVHEQELIEACAFCQFCQSPLELFRRYIESEVNDATLEARCISCRHRLAAGRRVHSRALLEAQRRVEQAIDDGYALVCGERLDTCVYFNGVRLLAVACVSARNAKPFRTAVGLRTGRKSLLDDIVFCKDQVFDELPARARGEVLCAIIKLTDNWPENFVQSARDAGLWRSYWRYHLPLAPYWIDRVVSEFLTPGVSAQNRSSGSGRA